MGKLILIIKINALWISYNTFYCCFYIRE